MHFEILVEGQSDLTTLSIIMNKIVGDYDSPHTWRIHKHRGLGQLPDKLNSSINIKDQTLLHNYPSKLRAYGKSMGEEEVVVLLVDLDDRDDCKAFKSELIYPLSFCDPKPNLLIRIAIEELESWFLGDQDAIFKAFPNAKRNLLESYIQDSQCNTWEFLFRVVNDPIINKLIGSKKRSAYALEGKLMIARKIAPHMDVSKNNSPSFNCFYSGITNFIK